MSATFSAADAARDAEGLIRRCLESVAWCDERILIDYPRAGDATVRRLRSLPRPAAALDGHRCRRLWVRRSVR
jgi:hypothetical protein